MFSSTLPHPTRHERSTTGGAGLSSVLAEYHLCAQEVAQIRNAAEEVLAGPLSPRLPAFFDAHRTLHRVLPPGLLGFLDDFRRGESTAGCLVHGFDVDDGTTGPTPSHWTEAVDLPVTVAEAYMAMCAVALGDPFTWATLQRGTMIQNIFPIKGDEERQSGHGSESLLEFHTEDGFHPGRCDYLMLFGVRNHERVPTLLASVRDVELDARQRQLLGEPYFHIVPDDEHIRQLMQDHPEHPALPQVLRMRRDPDAVPVLFGDGRRPYLRIDRPFMHCAQARPDAVAALDALMAELERATVPVVVDSGSLLVVDNYVAVHGRRAFSGRFDGTDRWLKRMIVSRNLRGTPFPGDAHPRVRV